MGKASRLKAARRGGNGERAFKQNIRRALKVDRRGRTVPPTVEAYERITALSTNRLAEALIARHNTRMAQIESADELATMQILSPLAPVATLYKALLGVGARPDRAPSSPVGVWPDHLMWGVDSAVAATRLLLCGQIVGAAVIVRHQMERWLLHRAHNGSLTQEPGESTADFIARVWSTEDRFHETWFVQSGVPLILDDSDLDSDGPDENIDHAHITTTDGRVLCPAAIYCGLSELLHGRLLPEALSWDSKQMLAGESWSGEVAAAVDVITGGLTLCLRQIRVAVAHMAQQAGDMSLAAMMKGSLDAFSTPDLDDSDHHRKTMEAVLRDFGVATEPPIGDEPEPETAQETPDPVDADTDTAGEADAVAEADHQVNAEIDMAAPLPRGKRRVGATASPGIVGIAPLLPHEGIAPYMVAPVARAAADFMATLEGARPAGRLYTDDEFVTLAFLWQRRRAQVVALTAMENEREMLGDEFNIDRLTGRAQNWVLLTEVTALMSTWVSTPSTVNAASVVGSGLRSAYWLWCEDDDRAMAMLRVVLEQTARLKVWREKPEKARELESRESTTPRDWLEKAGWRRLTALNRALGEFAHTKATSRWTGARELLARLQPDVDQERAIYTARGAAVDFVASLVASESIEQLRLTSPTVAAGVAKIFDDAGVDVADPSDRDVESQFNHIWAQRTADLGTPDFAGAAEQQDLAKKRTVVPADRRPRGQQGRGGTSGANAPASTNPFVKPRRVGSGQGP